MLCVLLQVPYFPGGRICLLDLPCLTPRSDSDAANCDTSNNISAKIANIAPLTLTLSVGCPPVSTTINICFYLGCFGSGTSMDLMSWYTAHNLMLSWPSILGPSTFWSMCAHVLWCDWGSSLYKCGSCYPSFGYVCVWGGWGWWSLTDWQAGKFFCHLFVNVESPFLIG